MNTGSHPLAEMRRFLDRLAVATLATVDEAGMPYAVSLYMVGDEHGRLHFASDPRAMHSRHIARQPRVHVAAHAPNARWTHTRGIQVAGRCERACDACRDEIARIYCRRFPFAASVLERASNAAFYRITPSRIRWIDNRVSFGFKRDFDWPLPCPRTS